MKRFLWASYGMYFLGGMTSVFFGAIMPELLNYYHATYTSGGLLILLQSIGFIIGVPLAVSFMKKYHYRYILSGAALAVAFAQLTILFLPRLFVVEALVILSGIGASALETAVASYIMEIYEGRRAIFMSRLEVSFGVGALILPAMAGGLIAIHAWRFSSLLVGGFALFLGLFWLSIFVPLEAKNDQDEQGYRDAQTAAPPIFKGEISKYSILLMFLLMILIYVGVEGILNSFLPTIFTVYVKTEPYFASLSSSVFWIAMVFGRLAIGWIVRRVSYERYLFASISLGILFIFFLTQVHAAWISYITVFGIGIAFSAIYSITMVYANHTFPGKERMVTSAVTAFAGIGAAVFPAIIGYAMDHFLPNQVLGMILGFSVMLLGLFLFIFFSLRFLRLRYKVMES